MELITKSILIGMAATGQTITKSTSISIALVIGIVVATMYVTNTYNNINNQLQNLNATVDSLGENQAIILKALQRQSILE